MLIQNLNVSNQNKKTMKKILGFLQLAIKWLSRTPSQTRNDSETSRYVLVDEVNKGIELAYYHWLYLSQKYRVIVFSKHSNRMRERVLLDLHYRIQALIKEHPELNGFDVRKGSPFFELISVKSLSKKDIIEKYGKSVLCIEVELLKHLVVTIITYNFFKKHRERAVDLFAEAETKMKALVEDNKLPGRFSWNTFVSKEEQREEKEEIDPAFLDLYELPDSEGDQKLEPPAEDGVESEKRLDEDVTSSEQ